MRILFLSSLYPPVTRGGGELSAHLIARALKARGHKIQVITAGIRREEYAVQDVPVLRLPVPLLSKPLFERAASRRIAAVLREEISKSGQWDVIHAHDFRTAQALSELGLLNAIVTARDYAQICGSPNNLLQDLTSCPGCTLKNVLKNHRVAEAAWWRKPFRVWQYWHNAPYRLSSFQKFKRQIFISEAQKNQIARIQNLNGVESRVIYNPVATEYLNRPAEKTVGKNILYAGTVESYKGVGLLLEAFKVLSAEDGQVQLKIVGQGAQRKQYEQYVDRHGLQYRVAFCNPVAWERMEQLYDDACLVAAPHVWIEPFGRTTAEAMARGRIVVAADVGGPAEMIRNGETGWLFKRGSAGSLKAALHRALNMSELDKREMERKARRWAGENLKGDFIARQHEEIYRTIV